MCVCSGKHTNTCIHSTNAYTRTSIWISTASVFVVSFTKKKTFNVTAVLFHSDAFNAMRKSDVTVPTNWCHRWNSKKKLNVSTFCNRKIQFCMPTENSIVKRPIQQTLWDSYNGFSVSMHFETWFNCLDLVKFTQCHLIIYPLSVVSLFMEINIFTKSAFYRKCNQKKRRIGRNTEHKTITNEINDWNKKQQNEPKKQNALYTRKSRIEILKSLCLLVCLFAVNNCVIC